MTAEEIRSTKNSADTSGWECAEWLREIAAQLAERNKIMTDMQTLAKQERDDRIAQQDKIIGLQGGLQDTLKKQWESPPVPMVAGYKAISRAPLEVGSPQHLGCVLHVPAGSFLDPTDPDCKPTEKAMHAIVIEPGKLKEIPEELAQQILALIKPLESVSTQ